MFFEDEKENLDNLDNLDDLEIDLDEDIDEESISWEELLKDSSDAAVPQAPKAEVKPEAKPVIQSIKEDKPQEVESDEEDIENLIDFDSDLEEIDEAEDIEPEPDLPADKKDAFEVFGGNSDDADLASADNIMDDDSQSILNELDEIESTVDLPDEDDEVSDDVIPAVAKDSRQLNIPAIAGIVFAAVLVLGSVFFIFIGPKNAPVQNPDVAQNIQEQPAQPETPENKEEVNVPPGKEEQIPVVDDKSAKKLKPDKKIVLAVESAGRINPFLPTFDEFNKNYYSGVPAQVLMPPESYGNEPDAQELMRIAVSGILFDNVKPSAIVTINDVDYFVQKGDMVDDYQVLDINRQSVVVKKGTNIYKAGVGERFNQNVTIDGSAVYGAGGVRRYTSPSNYTSASDVEVRAADGN